MAKRTAAERQAAWEARQREREARWRGHVNAWRGSGASQAAYCRQHGADRERVRGGVAQRAPAAPG